MTQHTNIFSDDIITYKGWDICFIHDDDARDPSKEFDQVKGLHMQIQNITIIDGEELPEITSQSCNLNELYHYSIECKHQKMSTYNIAHALLHQHANTLLSRHAKVSAPVTIQDCVSCPYRQQNHCILLEEYRNENIQFWQERAEVQYFMDTHYVMGIYGTGMGYKSMDEPEDTANYIAVPVTEIEKERIPDPYKYMEAVLTEYGYWAYGDTWGYKITKTDTGEELDALWGFYGFDDSVDYMLAEAKSSIDHYENEKWKELKQQVIKLYNCRKAA